MNIRGVTPEFQIANRAFRFQLRARDALALLSLSQLDQSQARGFLASCPEVLVLALAQSEPRPAIRISELLQSLDQDRSASSDVKPLAFDASEKREYLRVLRRFEVGKKKCRVVQSALTALVAGTTQLDEVEVDAWLSQFELDAEFWGGLSMAIPTDGASLQVDIQAGGPLIHAEFERRLHDEKMASMKQLAYGASHEINNPLANISSRAQMLLKDETDPGRRMRLARINQQAFRAHEMIADMMLFAHPPKPRFQSVDPVEVVLKVVSEVQAQADEQNTEIQTESGSAGRTHLDGNQLAVAVKALLTNSLEALQRDGVIQVSVQSRQIGSDETLEVTVSDNGPGIEPETCRHLFDPFYSGREAGRGLGFGLSKAWRIAELHGGEISAETPSHGGVRFCLRIPYRDKA